MTVQEVVKIAAENLGRQDLSQEIDALAGGTQEEEQGELQGELKSLVRCFNLVENEVALDYIPLKKTETFRTADSAVLYTRFSSSPADILSVKDGKGNALKFEIFPTHVFLPANPDEATVTYSYVPAQKAFGDESDFTGKVSARLLSFGVASEFCLTGARFQEAAMWEKRFHDALRAVNYLRRKLSIRSRRWV